MPVLEKKYLYKIYSNSIYLGLLENVISDFSYNHEINTTGAELRVEIAATLDQAGATSESEKLIKEDGDNLITEQGDNILVSQTFSFENIPMNLANRVVVYVYDDDDPNGQVVFDGFISKWLANASTNTIVLTVISQGIKMAHQLVQILPATLLVDNNTNDGNTTLFTPWKSPLGRNTKAAQTFQLVGASSVKTFSVGIGNSGSFAVPLSIDVYEGTPLSPGSLLATVNRDVSPQSLQLTPFILSNTIELDAGVDYFLQLSNTSFGISETNSIQVGINSTSTYGSGAAYYYNDSTGWALSASQDLQFTVETESGSIGNVFNSQDPSNILREILDNFYALGGPITYDDDSIDDTGSTVSYTFKFSSVYEGVQKVLELAPGNWYWYVDVATNLLHFHRQAPAAEHTFILGKHIAEAFDLEYTLEEVKNLVYFSGGDDGSGVNIFTTNSNSASQALYGTWMDRPSDNRVTLEDTANILSLGILQQSSYPIFRATVEITSENYDIETINLGQMINFKTNNSLIDFLLLQITSVTRSPQSVLLKLNILPPTVSKRIEDIKRSLEKQETIDNPDGL